MDFNKWRQILYNCFRWGLGIYRKWRGKDKIKKCVNMIKDYYMNNDISGAAEYLMKESTSRWMRDDDSVDDITLIIVFFE